MEPTEDQTASLLYLHPAQRTLRDILQVNSFSEHAHRNLQQIEISYLQQIDSNLFFFRARRKPAAALLLPLFYTRECRYCIFIVTPQKEQFN